MPGVPESCEDSSGKGCSRLPTAGGETVANVAGFLLAYCRLIVGSLLDYGYLLVCNCFARQLLHWHFEH